MNLERKVLISYMLGFIDGHKNGMTRQDRLIILDQQLIKLNQPPTTNEERVEFLQELATEIDATFMIAGLNRKDIRNLTFKS